jgi:hypothetical protein
MPQPSSASSVSDSVDETSVTITGLVVRIDDGIANVLVGPEREPWDFPLEMLPDDVAVDSVLVLERTGRRLRFVELDPVTEVERGRPFDLRLRRTARKEARRIGRGTRPGAEPTQQAQCPVPPRNEAERNGALG